MGKARRAKKREKQAARAERKAVRDKEIEKKGIVHRYGWSNIVKENEAFEAYYKAQQLVPDDQWDQFLETLRAPLPASFRITSYFGSQSLALKQIVESQNFMKNSNENNGTNNGNGDCTSEKPILTPLPWIPDGLGWQLSTSRVEIRKSERLQMIHNFLISETEAGFISRQEAVSMIPPLVLDVKPHHKVLDMCAAPGSKTAQIIELLHAGQDLAKGSVTGAVVANDIENKRCYLLVHQSKRLHSPCCIITNHDASLMPNFFSKDEQGNTSVLKFDRVLCDVPCSGDGTLRKNTDVWKSWNTGNGNNFHGLQVKIARRGMEMLAKDGLMVYSTCSFNPQEDEAVIANILNESKGTIELVDVSDKLPGLKTRKGLTSWKVMTRELKIVENPAEIEEKWATQIRESMFPPANAAELNLDRCIRILPHHQDTGGFFVAVLRKKVDTLPWENNLIRPKDVKAESEETDKSNVEVKTEKDEQTDQNEQTEQTVLDEPARKRLKRMLRKKEKVTGFKEDPFNFLNSESPEWLEVQKYYSVSSDFPSDQLMYRCTEGKKRNLYFLSKTAREIITNNEGRVKFVNAGVRLFARNTEKDFECSYRLSQEGLPSIYPYIEQSSILKMPIEDIKSILTKDNVHLEQLSPQIRSQVEAKPIGSCILLFTHKVKCDSNGNESTIVVPLSGWRGKDTLRPYIAKNERIHFLRLCGMDTGPLEDENRQQFLARQERKLARQGASKSSETTSET